MTKVVIIGGQGTAIVIADQIYDAHIRYGMDMEVIGLALDDRTMGNDICGYPILCGIREVYDKFKEQEDVKFIYSLYRDDQIRECCEILYSLNIPEEKWCNFIHPSAMVARSVKMGYGNVVLANCVINSNTTIGNFNTLNSGTLLGHDIIVGNNNFFAAQVTVGSMLEIGNMNFIGLNSAIRSHTKLGEANLVSQASNVTKSFDHDETIFGNPAMSHGTIKKKPLKVYQSSETKAGGKLIIVGLSKTAKHVLSFVNNYGLYNVIGFAVNEKYKTTETFHGLPVYTLENIEKEVGHSDFSVFVAMLWNRLNSERRGVYEYCKQKGFDMVNIVSPFAILRSPLKGDNCWIHDYVVVQQDTYIGSDVMMMSGTLIGANSQVGSHCFFGAHSLLGGGSVIGEQSFVGINSIVFDDTKVGRKCIIGACTAVKRNMPDYSRYVTKSDEIVVKQYAEEEIENKLIFSKNVR